MDLLWLLSKEVYKNTIEFRLYIDLGGTGRILSSV